jgi:hypothetical protein
MLSRTLAAAARVAQHRGGERPFASRALPATCCTQHAAARFYQATDSCSLRIGPRPERSQIGCAARSEPQPSLHATPPTAQGCASLRLSSTWTFVWILSVGSLRRSNAARADDVRTLRVSRASLGSCSLQHSLRCSSAAQAARTRGPPAPDSLRRASRMVPPLLRQ